MTSTSPPILTDRDLQLWTEGAHQRAYEKLGAHPRGDDGGVAFAVWAPGARSVSVVGDFNGWDATADPLEARTGVGEGERTGVWEGEVPSAAVGDRYKFSISPESGGPPVAKADPFGFHHEVSPATASVVWDLAYRWDDDEWMGTRHQRQRVDDPISVYEVHLGSWMRSDEGRPLSYRELAGSLTSYVSSMGFTHVELLPVMEHPFYGSWGYQTTGYFAPTSRYGTPQDFMFLVESLHRAGIGVILDWVPSHFPDDPHGLGRFDGGPLFEHPDPRLGFHPDWNSFVFDYGRPQVTGFLIASALFWLDRYHVDGIRVDAVASMLNLDYSREPGEWVPNRYGGNENLEAIQFVRRLNESVYGEHPGVQTYAEESAAWPMVSRPTFVGGLGFGFKWDMGWMNDVLEYMAHDPIHRRHHHQLLTFRGMYAFSENFILPLSHDEVVYGKGSLLRRMPGDEWQKFANLRLLLAAMWSQPGKKLLFMGGELAQWNEWNHETALDWHLLDDPAHDGIRRLVGDLNRLYRQVPALHARDCDPAGFEWIDADDSDTSAVTFLRRSGDGDTVAVALNFTPIPRHQYRVGLPWPGTWEEILNTDAPLYGGSGQGNLGGVDTGPFPVPSHGLPHSVDIVLPPLGAVMLRHRP